MGALATDREVVLTAIKKNIFALIYASKSLQSNKEILDIVINKAINLNNLSIALTNISSVALAFIKKDCNNFIYTSDELKNNPEFLLECIKINYEIFNLIDDKFKKNLDFMIQAFSTNNKIIYTNCFNKLQLLKEFNLDEFWFKIINKNKAYIKYLPNEFKSDQNFMSLFV